jgi:hypothetical protein
VCVRVLTVDSTHSPCPSLDDDVHTDVDAPPLRSLHRFMLKALNRATDAQSVIDLWPLHATRDFTMCSLIFSVLLFCRSSSAHSQCAKTHSRSYVNVRNACRESAGLTHNFIVTMMMSAVVLVCTGIGLVSGNPIFSGRTATFKVLLCTNFNVLLQCSVRTLLGHM